MGTIADDVWLQVIYGTYSVWLTSILIISMTSVCWWAFTYHREGFIPMMYGSLRIVCAATSDLKFFPNEGIKWGDRKCSLRLGMSLFGY